MGCSSGAPSVDDALEDTSAASLRGTAIWAGRIEGSQFPREGTTDANGNFIVGGNGRGTIDFGMGPRPIGGAFDTDIWLAKYGGTGSLLWAKTLPGPGDGVIGAIATDASRNVIVAGFGGADFGCGIPATEVGTYMVKLDPAGRCLWHRVLDLSIEDDVTFQGAAADPLTGDIVLAGVMFGSADLGGGWVLEGSSLIDRALVVKLAAGDGATVWAQDYSGTRNASFVDVEIDGAGDLVLAGHAGSTIDFGGGPRSPEGSFSLALVKLSSDGTHLWSDVYGTRALPVDVDVGPDGVIAVAGRFNGSIDFGTSSVATAFQEEDIYIAKFDVAGTNQWSKHLWGTPVEMHVAGVGIDSSGGVTAAGDFMALDPGRLFHIGAFAFQADDRNMFLARFGANSGGTVWARHIGGVGDEINPMVLAITPTDRILVAGRFAGNLVFDPLHTLNDGDGDGFLVRIRR